MLRKKRTRVPQRVKNFLYFLLSVSRKRTLDFSNTHLEICLCKVSVLHKKELECQNDQELFNFSIYYQAQAKRHWPLRIFIFHFRNTSALFKCIMSVFVCCVRVDLKTWVSLPLCTFLFQQQKVAQCVCKSKYCLLKPLQTEYKLLIIRCLSICATNNVICKVIVLRLRMRCALCITVADNYIV